MEEQAKKENNGSMVNTPMPKSRKKSLIHNIRVKDLKTVPGQTCSPVREETGEDEEFTSDLTVLDKKFALDKTKRTSLSASQSQRRQTIAAEGSDGNPRVRRVSFGGRTGSGRRVSFGGTVTHSLVGPRTEVGGAPPSAQANSSLIVSDLKDELTKRERLDHTRQQRLNGMDIKLKQSEKRYANLKLKYDEVKKEKEELLRQVNDLKKKNKHLAAGKRRLELNKQQQEHTITQLLSKVGNGGLKKNGAGAVPHASCAKACATSDSTEQETFGDAAEVLGNLTAASNTSEGQEVRRYTMAPGEVSRIRRTKKTPAPVTESHYVRIDGLEKGTNSHKLLDMCKQYGDIVQLRVTSDVITGVLKGYVTFLKPKFARAAVDGFAEKGFKAMLVEKA
eukprot:CAMPEP_0203776686 /NCGR_PEP_ID=MMETSP0099_2-20121227/6902_1 /ASSEMBLY_ACC=CAM_ASM_000209 /TAXON_ID=96639 /ORGANISM=" , Strain NY0313808BC1" /LENGTH=391 /DNA_ID=CAMNT_0050675757 /DNA_START=337 /DNA_END=1512 /DNA_ORIENTATION=-